VEVIVADNAGFCFGVKRAIKMANETMEAAPGEVKAYGQLIHNPQVVASFAKRGLEVVDTLEAVAPEDTVIIRSHGVGPDVKAAANVLALRVVDTTCPFVTKAQEYARRLLDDNYRVVMIGDRNHPEVMGVVAHTEGKAIVLNSAEEADRLKFIPRMGVVFQTTHSIGHVQEVVGALLRRGKEIRVFNTLCGATTAMQKTAVELAPDVDGMIVVGGRSSANTAQLAEVCRRVNPRVWHVESAAEVREEWFAGMSRVGVTAGASTPDDVIAEVVDRVQRIGSVPAARNNGSTGS
jgi:4-hydroxy-3-methylbut-2-enyl diphosphate reductase